MNLKGYIKTAKKIKIGNSQCYGVSTGYGNKFGIRIEDSLMKKHPAMFLRVLLHEIIHLYFFIVDDYTRHKLNLTEGVQHKIMGKLVKELVDKVLHRALRTVRK